MSEKRNVVWLASYPKSGNTWLQFVVQSAGRAHGFPTGPMDVYDLQREGRMPEPCPAVQARLCSSPCVVLKTHSPYRAKVALHTFKGITLSNVAGIYIYRNPLDLLLSYINYTRMEYPRVADNSSYSRALFTDLLGRKSVPAPEDWRGTSINAIPQEQLDHALAVFSEKELQIPTMSLGGCGWAEHIRSWTAARRDIQSLILRYEDCLRDSGYFRAVCDLFVFSENEALAAAARAKDNAQRLSTGGNMDERVFYNKRESFYFRRYFSAAAIERFVRRHESELREFGYESLL